MCLQAIAHITVLVGVCYRMLKPVKTVLSRRNKKKKGNIIPLVRKVHVQSSFRANDSLESDRITRKFMFFSQ